MVSSGTKPAQEKGKRSPAVPAAVLAVPHGLSPGSWQGQQAAGSERSPKTLPEFGSFKIEDKGREGCPSVGGYRNKAQQWQRDLGVTSWCCQRAKQMFSSQTGAGLRERSCCFLSLPRQKVEQQADPPVSPLPSGHRQDPVLAAARDLSGEKSKDETGSC